MPTTDNSKELSLPEEEDPDDGGPGDAPTTGGGGRGALISGKGQETATQAVAVVTPIAEGRLLYLYIYFLKSSLLKP